CQATNTSYWIITDGKKGLEYGTVSDVRFTAEGKPVYMATNNNKNYIVVGDEESSGYGTIIQPVFRGAFIPTVIAGNKVGFIGLTPGTTDNFSVVIGSNKPVARRLASHLVLSPDGSRFAFTSPDGGANVDGVDDGSVVAEYQRIVDDHGGTPG